MHNNSIIHGSHTITLLHPVIDSIHASGPYPSPVLNLFASTGRMSKLQPTLMQPDSGYEYTLLEPKILLYSGSDSYNGVCIGEALSSSFPLHSWVHDNYLKFTIPLGYFAIEYIEQNRDTDLLLTLKGNVTIAVMKSIEFGSDFLGNICGYTKGELSLSFHIPQSTWVNNVLGKVGHRKFHLIELEHSHECQIQAALSYINKIDDAYGMHNYDNVALLAREMLDNLCNHYSDNERISNDERWKRVIGKLKNFCSLFMHKEEIGKTSDNSIEMQRYDAEYIILEMKIIIRYAQQIANDSKQK